MSSADAVDDLEIRPVDGRDDALRRGWQRAYEAAETAGRRYATPWTSREVHAKLRHPVSRFRQLLLAGRVGSTVVGCGWVTLPLLDNLTQAYVQVYVDPEHRRHGYGSSLLAAVEAHSREAGRNVLLAEVHTPLDLPPDGAGHPDADWAARRGYSHAMSDVHRVLDLPVPPALLVAEAAAPYELRTFAGPVPDELVEGYVALASSLVTEAPTGDIDFEPEAADVPAFREDESQQEEQGRRRWAAVALVGGEVVGYTDVVVNADDDVFQWGTLVRRDHRGHGLGLALKAANLRLLQADRPDLRLVHTWNSADNAHMIRVNDALGYRPVERLGEFQKVLDR